MVHTRIFGVSPQSICALIAGVLLPASVAAQSRALFSSAPVEPRIAARSISSDAMVVRTRRATADLTMLSASGSVADAGFASSRAAARSIDLNLFDDVDVTAQLDHVETIAPLGYAWVGRVAGVDGSQVVLSVAGGALTGTVKTPGKLYSVRQDGGAYTIAEIDTAVIPGDQVLVRSREREAASITAAAAAGGDEDIDLLLYYTPAVRQAAGSAAALSSYIAGSIAEVNTVYLWSGINAHVRLAAALEIDYTESGSTATDLAALRANPGVGAARDRYGADVVSMVVASDPAFSGMGYVSVSQGSGSPDLAFSVSVYYANVSYIYALAHELGHNLGCLHERGNNAGNDALGAFPFSFGYTDNAHRFHDVMSYGTGCANCVGLLEFSNPLNSYNGSPVGTDAQDAARTINLTRAIVANYRAAAGSSGAPGAPSGLTATASGSSVSLAWNAPADGRATAFVIEAGSSTGLANLANFSTGSAATTFSGSGVAGGTYYVRVRATNAAGTSAPSNEVTLIVR